MQSTATPLFVSIQYNILRSISYVLYLLLLMSGRRDGDFVLDSTDCLNITYQSEAISSCQFVIVTELLEIAVNAVPKFHTLDQFEFKIKRSIFNMYVQCTYVHCTFKKRCSKTNYLN